jgi:hypothetical protein
MAETVDAAETYTYAAIRTATAQAKPRDASPPALPPDWPPNDEFGPPPDDLFL